MKSGNRYRPPFDTIPSGTLAHVRCKRLGNRVLKDSGSGMESNWDPHPICIAVALNLCRSQLSLSLAHLLPKDGFFYLIF
ncbi:unnamed protein product [Echinostoma caproni]|uniref:Uncharacterized protein n=1 Tax=Echinostoma caproni TaxID=27848 RepID=A0A183AW19_9TREM|nr:unnamed protein product [Echinostoma caproni]